MFFSLLKPGQVVGIWYWYWYKYRNGIITEERLHILSHVPGQVNTLAIMIIQSLLYCQLRVRTLFNCVPVRIRTVLTPTETLYSDSILLVLNGTSGKQC